MAKEEDEEEGKPHTNDDDDEEEDHVFHSLTDTEDEEDVQDEDTDDDNTEGFTTPADVIDPLCPQEDVIEEGELEEQLVDEDDEVAPKLVSRGL